MVSYICPHCRRAQQSFWQPEMLTRCPECCEALDETFVEDVAERIEPNRERRAKRSVITIVVSRGLVEEVKNLPADMDYEIIDLDERDECP